jgi:truncated hemoglobin YjbI
MTRVLYEKLIPADDLLAPVFADIRPGHPQREAMWLAEVFGGPAWYSQQCGGAAAIQNAHAGRGFTEAQRARWATLAMQAADEARLPADPAFRAALAGYQDWGSRIAQAESTSATPQPGSAAEAVPHWDWPAGGPPAADGADAGEHDKPSVALPEPGAAVSFDAHVKPLFRASDRDSMKFALDLWSRADVTAHAADILERLGNGTMPCDGAWPPEQVDVFRRWTESGFQP